MCCEDVGIGSWAELFAGSLVDGGSPIEDVEDLVAALVLGSFPAHVNKTRAKRRGRCPRRFRVNEDVQGRQ